MRRPCADPLPARQRGRVDVITALAVIVHHDCPMPHRRTTGARVSTRRPANDLAQGLAWTTTLRPERYRNSIVPHIYVDGASDGIAFYKRAFAAHELFRFTHPNGRILHAALSICDSVFMIGDPDERLYGDPRTAGRCTASLHIFTNDDAALLRRAVDAGAKEVQAPTEMFPGASSASVQDPFGHVWVLLSWKEDQVSSSASLTLFLEDL